MYNEKIEALIKAALADGVLTEKEKQVLFKNAQAQGIDLDEFEMVLDARLVELQKEEKEKAAKSAPKSDKFGDVRKCPACGALVPALATVCAECGYEFSGIGASSSAQILSKKIEQIKLASSAKKAEIISSKKYSTMIGGSTRSPQEEALYQIRMDEREQIESTITTFPIPNAKNDLFDLILFLKNHLNDAAYSAKFNECVERADYLFHNDPLFKQVISGAKKAKKDYKIENISVGILSGFVVLGIFAGWYVMYLRGVEHDWSWWQWIGGVYLYVILGGIVGFALGAIVRMFYLKIMKIIDKN